MLPPWTSPFAEVNATLDAEEEARDLLEDELRARAREVRFPMADFEDEDGRLPEEVK